MPANNEKPINIIADGGSSARAACADAKHSASSHNSSISPVAAEKLFIQHQHNDDNHAVDAATNTVAASSQGAMFVAGFAYYEIGRFSSGNQDCAYLSLLTGALSL